MREKLQAPRELDQRFDVVFVEDGSILESCRYFKFNLKSLLQELDGTPQEQKKHIAKEFIH